MTKWKDDALNVLMAADLQLKDLRVSLSTAAAEPKDTEDVRDKIFDIQLQISDLIGDLDGPEGAV